jgi:hypothetical protein
MNVLHVQVVRGHRVCPSNTEIWNRCNSSCGAAFIFKLLPFSSILKLKFWVVGSGHFGGGSVTFSDPDPHRDHLFVKTFQQKLHIINCKWKTFASVLWIRDILIGIRMRICGSVRLSYGSGSFLAFYFLKVHLHQSSKIKSQKESQNRRNQSFSNYLCLIMEGSGSWRPKMKKTRILRIRIQNTLLREGSLQ